MDSHTNKPKLHISINADDRLVSYLEAKGYEICPVSSFGTVTPQISDHADVFYCRMGAESAAQVIAAGTKNLTEAYPGDCAYNAACTGKYLICRVASTAPEILEFARERGMQVINVRQGYAKCSTVVVDENSIITYDRGIAKACAAAGGRIIEAAAGAKACTAAGGLTVLLVSPGHVLLPGLDTGFIGGASGRVGDEIIFNGDLSAHPDFVAIVSFIESRGLRCKWFPEWPLTDIGSIV